MHFTLNNSGLKIDANVSLSHKKKNYFKIYFNRLCIGSYKGLLLNIV